MVTLKFRSPTSRLAAAAGLFAATVVVSAQTSDPRAKTSSPEMNGRTDEMVRDWPRASREAIEFMTHKYGAPAAVTRDAVLWGKTGPWKRTVVYRKEYPHEFPMHHTDVMQQWIDYKTDPDKLDDLAEYDGSVVFERTSGEASARCDKEGANFLALNLADEIVRGTRSVSDARKTYGEQIMAMKAKKPAPYTEKLMFSPMSDTNDPDRSLSASAEAAPR